MKKILIKNALILTMDDGNVIQDGSILTAGDTITSVGPGLPPEPAEVDTVIDAKGGMVLPGLINAHTHIAMTLFRGFADDMTLQDWLFNSIFPAEDKLDDDAVYWASLLACAEMIRGGTTMFADMYFFNRSTVRAALEAGVNANISRCVSGTHQDYKARLAESRELFREFDGAGNGSIRIEHSAHAVYTCSREAIHAVAEAAAEDGTGVHVHLSETMKENRDCYRQYGKSPTEIFEDCGVFENRTNAAHCVYLSENDMDIIKRHGVGISHNPVSNLKLASGVANIKEILEKGIYVGIGTDGVASNNSLDMFGDMKTAALLQKGMRLDPTLIEAKTALEMATIGGAKLLGRERERGRIKEGYRADIIILDGQSPNLYPVHHPVSSAVYSAGRGDVVTSIINGNVVMENRELKTVDMERICAGVKEAISRMGI